jgi:Xaa-Pro aminopeptidase
MSIPPELKRAQDVARAVVAQAKQLVVEGVTEIELSQQIDRIAAECGSSGLWSPTTSRVGLGTLVAHPDFPMQHRAAVAGDICIIDVACTVDGWCGDYCESVVVGQGPAAAELLAECREISQLLQVEIRPGMRASKLYEYGANVLQQRNLKLLDLLDNFGHSVGVDFATDGFINAGNHTEMFGGWTIEPHVGRQAQGAKFEDILWLDHDGSVTVV